MFNGEIGENIMKLKETSNILTEQHNSYVFNSSCATITTCHNITVLGEIKK